jgi:hypothetical protein
MADEKRKYADPIVLLGVVVLLLMVCVSLSFRYSHFIAGSFRIDEVQICEELDENMRPVNVERNMSPESSQVCIWFSYSRARRGDLIEIAWYHEESMIQREIFRLYEPRGVKAFYLLREDGSPLESGFYTVHISCNGRGRVTENFTIAPSIDYIVDDFLTEDLMEDGDVVEVEDILD